MRTNPSNFVQVIEHWGNDRPGFGGEDRDEDDEGTISVRRAQAIIGRLKRRDLYKWVEEFLVPPADLTNST